MSNPILIEVTRGPLVESFHRGAVAITRPIKAIQCLPLIETGAADRYGFANPEIALACASHTGTDRHTRLAADMLARVGLAERDLGCGAHPPLGASAAKALWLSGRDATQLHNNCSGKHAGMLATAVHLGEPTEGYFEPDHPVQRRVLETLSQLCDCRLGPEVMGRDGCSVPNWAMPLSTMATLFARLVTGEGLPPARRAAIERILAACWAEPDLVAGPGRADTVVMRNLPGEVFMKTGAEGVYCGGFPELGIGFALKVDDGAAKRPLQVEAVRARGAVALGEIGRNVHKAGQASLVHRLAVGERMIEQRVAEVRARAFGDVGWQAERGEPGDDALDRQARHPRGRSIRFQMRERR